MLPRLAAVFLTLALLLSTSSTAAAQPQTYLFYRPTLSEAAASDTLAYSLLAQTADPSQAPIAVDIAFGPNVRIVSIRPSGGVQCAQWETHLLRCILAPTPERGVEALITVVVAPPLGTGCPTRTPVVSTAASADYSIKHGRAAEVFWPHCAYLPLL